MKVLKVTPCQYPYVIEIDDELETLQREVGGYIEAIYPFADDVAIVCNEEGKITGLPLNRALRSDDGAVVDVLCGNFLIVGLTEDGFGSLSDEQIKTYTKLYTEDTGLSLGELLDIMC